MNKNEGNKHRPESIAHSELLFQFPIVGIGLYKLILRDASDQQTFYRFSRKDEASYQGTMARLVQPVNVIHADGSRGFTQWTASKPEGTFEETANRLEAFNRGFSERIGQK